MEKKLQKLISIALIASFFGMNLSFAEAYPSQYSNNVEQTLEQIFEENQTLSTESFDGATLKAGENFAVELVDSVDSQNNLPKDEITAKLLFPIEVDNQVIIPEGSIVRGKITILKKAGGWYKNAKVKIEFTQIECEDEYKLPIIAAIKTKDNTGMLLGVGNNQRLKKIFSVLAPVSLGGAIAGFGIGLMGAYALVGAAVGFALGFTTASGWLLFQKGNPVNISSGTKLIITLENDVAIDGFSI